MANPPQGLRTDHHAGTTWGPVGQTPVVVKTGERKSISMISAISPRGELRFRVQEGRMNADRFIDFLKALLDRVPGKIFLIVDVWVPKTCATWADAPLVAGCLARAVSFFPRREFEK
jgi:DDE superfamily endonuclease